jgi:hypothetical protein
MVVRRSGIYHTVVGVRIAVGYEALMGGAMENRERGEWGRGVNTRVGLMTGAKRWQICFGCEGM